MLSEIDLGHVKVFTYSATSDGGMPNVRSSCSMRPAVVLYKPLIMKIWGQSYIAFEVGHILVRAAGAYMTPEGMYFQPKLVSKAGNPDALAALSRVRIEFNTVGVVNLNFLLSVQYW